MRGSITKRGRASWRIKFDLPPGTDGKRRTQFVTVRGGKKDAQAKLAEMLAAVGKGNFVEPSKLTVTEHVRARVDQWLTAGDIGAKTGQRYVELLSHQIGPHIGAMALQKLSTSDLEAWHGALRKAGLSSRTIRHAHRLLGKAMGDAVRHGLLVRNVAGRDGQRAPKVDDAKEVEILTADQIADALGKLKGRAIYPKVVTALYTGMRRGELLGLRWRAVDLVGKSLKVVEAIEETTDGLRFKRPKSKAGVRELTLPDVVVDQLERRMKLGLGRLPDDALVFPALDGGPARPSNLSGDWREAVAMLGLPRVSWHSLRHCHASMLIAAKVDVVTVSRRLGHASPQITLAIYARAFKETDAAAADAINAATRSL
jgi:integrase